ncbi:uncharacterized protein [Aphelocoma coerulescens]|uniref:uncharacterized protein isoform X2 n=1 Tax=Aphelocoma coerulescens TaxID=39617 RepID=UPI00360518AE
MMKVLEWDLCWCCSHPAGACPGVGLKFRQENTQAQHQVLAVPCDRREMPPVPEINRSGKNFITEMLHWRFLGFHRILSADILLGMDHWESIHTSSVLGAAVVKLFGIAAWKMPTLSCASIHQSLCNPNQEKDDN